MPLANLIDQQVQTPTQTVRVAGALLNGVVKVDYSTSFDQNSGNCTITLNADANLSPNNTDEVKVYQGYGIYNVATFTGYVDSYSANIPEGTWEVKLRDKLKRAEDIWLDDVGVTYTSTQAETAVADLLSRAGLSVSAGVSNFTIADTHPVEFKLCSILDAVQQIAALIGWRIWCGPDGTIFFRYRKPRPNDSTATWRFTYGENIISRKYEVLDKDLRNSIIVKGYNDIRSAARADSPATDIDRVAILSSELIDTQGMADTIAAWMLSDLNTLTYVYSFDCFGNPYVTIGRSVWITDSNKGIDDSFFVFSITSTMDGNSGKYTYKVTAVRWGPSSTPNYDDDDDPPPDDKDPDNPPPGKGNLGAVSTDRGLALFRMAYGTDGTDGTPSWENLSAKRIDPTGTITRSGTNITGSGTLFTTQVAVNDRIIAIGIDGTVTAITDDTHLAINSSGTNPVGATFTVVRPLAGLVPDALRIRAWNYDPWSVRGDHFTRAYVMTLAGFYEVKNLPNNPTWGKLIDATDMATLLGVAGADMVYSFAVSVRQKGYVALIGIDTATLIYYFCWSTDYGFTWNTSAPTYSATSASTLDQIKTLVEVQASVHEDNVFYISDFFTNALPNYPNPPFGAIQATLCKVDLSVSSEIIPIQKDGEVDRERYTFPYCDIAGAVYPSDSVAYWWGGSATTFRTPHLIDMSVVYPTTNGGTDLGGYDTGGVRAFYVHGFDENRMYAIPQQVAHAHQVWESPDRGSNWYAYEPTATGEPRSLFPIPIDYQIIFSVGRGASSTSAHAVFTTDFGTTKVRFDNPAGGTLDEVMFLTATADMDYSTIIVDYYNVDGEGKNLTSNANGIDVSHYQGTMDWDVAKAAGIDFAFIKASEGSSYTDPQFATNWAAALAAGVNRGAYHYFINNVDPTDQANHFLSVLGSDHGEIAMALDCEDTTHGICDSADIKTFLDVIEAALGYKPIIYTGAWWWDNPSYRTGDASSWASDYPLWIGSWTNVPSLPDDWTDYLYWQFSSKGRAIDYGSDTDTTIDLDRG